MKGYSGMHAIVRRCPAAPLPRVRGVATRPVGLRATALALVCATLAGCGAPEPTPGTGIGQRGTTNRWTVSKTLPRTSRPESPTAPEKVRAATPGTNAPSVRYPVLIVEKKPVGRVLLRNAQARFVVIDFSFGPRPPSEARLGVFRGPQRVGTVRVSGAPQGSLLAADVVDGEADVDDEVRAE